MAGQRRGRVPARLTCYSVVVFRRGGSRRRRGRAVDYSAAAATAEIEEKISARPRYVGFGVGAADGFAEGKEEGAAVGSTHSQRTTKSTTPRTENSAPPAAENCGAIATNETFGHDAASTPAEQPSSAMSAPSSW